jgi:hypothetical protein
MSYTQFIATASCSVVDDFNLQSYLDGLSVRCVEEENFIFEFYGLDSNDDLDVDFADYVRISGGKLLIECDSEEINSNSEVWDWLIDQFLPVMTGKMMEIHTASIDSRSGLDSSNGFYTKSGRWIGSDDILRIAEESGIFDELN